MSSAGFVTDIDEDKIAVLATIRFAVPPYRPLSQGQDSFNKRREFSSLVTTERVSLLGTKLQTIWLYSSASKGMSACHDTTQSHYLDTALPNCYNLVIPNTQDFCGSDNPFLGALDLTRLKAATIGLPNYLAIPYRTRTWLWLDEY